MGVAKEELKQLQEQKGQLQHTWGKLKQKLSDAEKQQQQAQKAANQGVPEQARELLLQRIGETPRLEDAYLTAVEKELERLIEHTSNQNTSAKNSATYIIGQFRGKDKWSHIALQREWAVGLAALDDCVAYFHELEKEGLPALVEQFEQRLQKHTMQSLSVIQNRLEADREEITDRIAIINQVLRRTEF